MYAIREKLLLKRPLEMENENYEVYKNAYFTIKNDRTKKLVKGTGTG